MRRQGDGHTGQEDDWWGQLYDDENSDDTGGARTGDTLDDRFASAAGTLRPRGGQRREDWWERSAAPAAEEPQDDGAGPRDTGSAQRAAGAKDPDGAALLEPGDEFFPGPPVAPASARDGGGTGQEASATDGDPDGDGDDGTAVPEPTWDSEPVTPRPSRRDPVAPEPTRRDPGDQDPFWARSPDPWGVTPDRTTTVPSGTGTERAGTGPGHEADVPPVDVAPTESGHGTSVTSADGASVPSSESPFAAPGAPSVGSAPSIEDDTSAYGASVPSSESPFAAPGAPSVGSAPPVESALPAAAPEPFEVPRAADQQIDEPTTRLPRPARRESTGSPAVPSPAAPWGEPPATAPGSGPDAGSAPAPASGPAAGRSALPSGPGPTKEPEPAPSPAAAFPSAPEGAGTGYASAPYSAVGQPGPSAPTSAAATDGAEPAPYAAMPPTAAAESVIRESVIREPVRPATRPSVPPPSTAEPSARAGRDAAPGSPSPVLPLPRAPWESGAAIQKPRTFASRPAPAPEPEAPVPGDPAGETGATGTVSGSRQTYVGDGPPTYDAEPSALQSADPEALDELVADTVLDGARYGTGTLRAVSVRGDSARYRGEPRRDSLLTARFGSGENALILVAMSTGARAMPGAHLAAAEACGWIGQAVGRSHARLAEDIRAGRRGDLKAGLQRLTDRSLGKLRARAAELGADPDGYTATLRCLLLSADPDCRMRVFFGVGGGGLFRLRDGLWEDIEPTPTEPSGPMLPGYAADGDDATVRLGITKPPSPYSPAHQRVRDPFRFRTSTGRPGDVLLLCTAGLAEPLRGEPALAECLTERWSQAHVPGLGDFLADAQVRVKGYADDRTAAAVWEA